ncbi:DUF4249 family protein [Rhodohalobacter sp. 8-1]|uniref:DUF4249 family protein n=1 Tax=Rhodohalobacter sp. 8-1 TaxID=3131972 RepID=UPI0030ED0F09
MRTYINLYAVIVLFVMFGCDVYEQDDYQELVVLEAYAIAGRPLPDVRLSTTSPATEEYNFRDVALNDAIVVIAQFDGTGQTVADFSYSLRSDGVYRADDRSTFVQPGTRYQIQVQFDSRQEQLSAETVVPQQFEVLSDVNESYVYQSENQLEILLTATESNANQNVYVFNTITREPDIDNLTPFYLDAVVNGNSDIEEFLNNSSGLINEGNFEINDDQTILLRFPWIGVAFFGENAVVINSADPNLADLVRSEELQLGGSTLPPGEIPNLIYDVKGGIGVFGSISTDTLITKFTRPQTQ